MILPLHDLFNYPNPKRLQDQYKDFHSGDVIDGQTIMSIN